MFLLSSLSGSVNLGSSRSIRFLILAASRLVCPCRNQLPRLQPRRDQQDHHHPLAGVQQRHRPANHQTGRYHFLGRQDLDLVRRRQKSPGRLSARHRTLWAGANLMLLLFFMINRWILSLFCYVGPRPRPGTKRVW